MTSEPDWNNGPEEVEWRLRNVCNKLKKSEVTAAVLGRMVREGVATADVRSFIGKQARLKRTNSKIHSKRTIR